MKRRLKGKVVSCGAAKTAVVLIERSIIHPIYKKRFVASKKFSAHCEIDINEGDVVIIEETRPISKRKKWLVIEKIEKGKAKE